MNIFAAIDDHFEYLSQLVSKGPKGVFLASFGMYAGILHDGRDTTTFGKNYQSLTRLFLDSIKNTPNVKLLIGLADYKSCNGKISCEHCERGYIYQMIRLLNHQELYSNFKWKVACKMHVKCSLFFYDSEISGVIGGRNLNDSDSFDMTFSIQSDACKSLYTQILPTWRDAYDLNASNIGVLLEKQGIRESTVNKILLINQ